MRLLQTSRFRSNRFDAKPVGSCAGGSDRDAEIFRYAIEAWQELKVEKPIEAPLPLTFFAFLRVLIAAEERNLAESIRVGLKKFEGEAEALNLVFETKETVHAARFLRRVRKSGRVAQGLGRSFAAAQIFLEQRIIVGKSEITCAGSETERLSRRLRRCARRFIGFIVRRKRRTASEAERVDFLAEEFAFLEWRAAQRGRHERSNHAERVQKLGWVGRTDQGKRRHRSQ